MCVFQSKLGQSYSDVEVVLQFNGLYAMKRHICEHHKILAHAIDAIHCVMTNKRNDYMIQRLGCTYVVVSGVQVNVIGAAVKERTRQAWEEHIFPRQFVHHGSVGVNSIKRNQDTDAIVLAIMLTNKGHTYICG